MIAQSGKQLLCLKFKNIILPCNELILLNKSITKAVSKYSSQVTEVNLVCRNKIYTKFFMPLGGIFRQRFKNTRKNTRVSQ